MIVEELRRMLDGQTRDAAVIIDGADSEGFQLWLRPVLVRPRHGDITIVANAGPERDEPVVWVVPGELSDPPAVFRDQEDAERFAATYDPPRAVESLIVCNAETAAKMVAEREDDE